MKTASNTSLIARLLTVTFVFLGAFAVSAQEPFEFRHFGSSQGLSNGHINALAQTEDGHLIISHRTGASTFDGRNFRDLTLADSSVVGSVQDVLCRKDGSVLMGAENGEIYEYFKKELFRTTDTLPNSVVRILYDEQNEQELIFSRNMQVMIKAQDQVKVFSAPVQEILLTSVVHISGNRFLIGTNSGLFNAQIDLNHGFEMLWEEPIPMVPSNKITALLHESGRKLTWIATEDQGMYLVKYIHMEKQTTQKVDFHYPKKIDRISELCRDRFGNLWIGTFGEGVYRAENVNSDFRGARIKHFNVTGGHLTNDLVTKIYEDTEGNIWIGTFGGGLTQIIEKVFYQPFEPTFLRSHTVNTVLPDSKGNVWLGIEQGVFLSKTVLGKTSFEYYYLGGNEVTSIVEDQSGNIWLGTPRSGTWKLNAGRKEFVKVSVGKDPLLNSVNELVASPEGVLICTKGGIVRVNSAGKVDFSMSTLSGLPHNNIKSAFIDSKGRLWIGPANNRVVYIVDNKVNFIEEAGDQRIVDVDCILEDDKGRLWFGTNGSGIHVLDGSQVTNLTSERGLSSDYVYQLNSDGLGYIWSLHQKEINLIDSGLKVVRVLDERHFEISENSMVTSSYTDTEEITWITTSHSVVKYNPRVNKLREQSPKVVITDMFIMNEPYKLEAGLTLPYRKYNIRFHYSGISLRDPDGIQYRYLLEGYNSEWSQPISSDKIEFPKLEDGNYRLMIQASKENGEWSAESAVYEFVIKRPFWKSWWFFTVALFVLVSSVYLFVRYRTYRLVKDNIELEAIITERTSEIQQQKEEIEQNRDEIARSAKDITDSIKYAKRIQKAIFPANLDIKRILPDSFIFFRSKGIVSGDFYFVEEVNDKAIVAAVDCTGHGVPGAFMSIVANNLLHQAVKQIGLSEPASILNYMNKGISETLHQTYEESSVRDGLDIAIICWDKRTNNLQYAGAFNPLYHFRNGELTQLKGNRFPVGMFVGEKLKTFDNQQMQLETGDVIYLFSDGFADQFGGTEGKKFKLKRFRQFLTDIHQRPMQEQYESAFNTLKDWQGGLDQVDDILIMGIRIA